MQCWNSVTSNLTINLCSNLGSYLRTNGHGEDERIYEGGRLGRISILCQVSLENHHLRLSIQLGVVNNVLVAGKYMMDTRILPANIAVEVNLTNSISSLLMFGPPLSSIRLEVYDGN